MNDLDLICNVKMIMTIVLNLESCRVDKSDN